MKVPLPLVSILISLLFMAVGCTGVQPVESKGTVEAVTAVATTAPIQSQDVTATTTLSDAEVATPDATATEALTGIITGTITGTAETEAGEIVTSTAGTVFPVEEVAEINSYQMDVLIASDGARGASEVRIAGSYVKEPRAEHMEVILQEGAITQTIEAIFVDEKSYMWAGDEWIEAPGGAIEITDITLMRPQDAAAIFGQMEEIGPEKVNDLSTTHYRAAQEVIPTFGMGSDTMDVSGLDAAQLDMWVDETYNAIVKFMLTGSENEAATVFTLTFEYADLNGDIEIAGPIITTVEVTEEEGAQGDFVPRNELGEMLGFNLMLPVDSTVETVDSLNHYVVVTPFTLEEAPVFIEQSMQSNGYSQVSKEMGPEGEVVYLFQMEPREVSITLSDAGDGKSRIEFAIGP